MLITDGTRVAMIDRERESRKERYHYAGPPRRAFMICPDDPTNQRIPNLVFDAYVVNDGAARIFCQHLAEDVIIVGSHDVIKNWFSM